MKKSNLDLIVMPIVFLVVALCTVVIIAKSCAVRPDPTPTATQKQPTATATQKPTATKEPTKTVEPTATKTQEPTATQQKPTATKTKEPTATQQPTATPTKSYQWYNCYLGAVVNYPRVQWHPCNESDLQRGNDGVAGSIVVPSVVDAPIAIDNTAEGYWP